MTSLSVASQIATSSLTATQVQLSVASANIANADTEGYTRKSATQTSQTTAGVGTGVSISGITSKVDAILLANLNEATSKQAAASTTADYLDRLQSLFGSTSGDDGTGSALSNTLADVESALSELASTPESTSAAASALSELDTLSAQLRELSSDIQDLRAEADAAIAASVDSANEAITTIDALNEQIVAGKARGESTADLEDQRNQALQTLSESLGVSSLVSDNGSMKVYTTSGQVLVDGSAHYLSFDSASVMTSERSYDGTDAGLSGITLNGTDIAASISNGEIKALLSVRDETLPAAQDMIDTLASTVIETVNAVRPDLLTGTDASDIAVSADLLADPGSLLDDTDAAAIATALLAALQEDSSFEASGSLAATQGSMADYATDILSVVVGQANSAAARLETADSRLTSISDAITSDYGVNLDEETARLSELSQLYSTSAQVLSTIQEMFDALLAAVS
ncbi:flagellar hook-associated protein FlgK [Breoghania sp. L-A4]|uniref:flagellar hook-associated protein FlgK n=1 Tax=Breoghania sp. L-A4 TaxID=2304600 RepID=UPI000E358C32|nr:flagellar hook-associated protein FlgK [Breoghania sp. L-A4]AXS41586.1 flagellar hook-associated protein FlgK [Breoghania sp. L-A4]